MRMRALRWSIALAVAVGAAVTGVGVHHTSLRAVLRDVTRSTAAAAHAVSAAGLSGSETTSRTVGRAVAADAMLTPAVLLAAGLALLVAGGALRRRVPVRARVDCGPRAPPVQW